MQENFRDRLSIRLRGAVLAVIAGGIATASAAHANPSVNIVVVPPTALPESARQAGEAMLLRDSIDGRAILYVEQDRGARLAIFDVTDPVHVKGEGSVQLSEARPFDFVSSIGSTQELIEYRTGHEYAVLDFRKVMLPNLKAVQGLTLQGSITRLGNDGFIVANEATRVAGEATSVPPARDYQVVDTTSSPILTTVFSVNQVRETITKADTGTTFLLAKDGLYVVRQPYVESEKKRRDEEWIAGQ